MDLMGIYLSPNIGIGQRLTIDTIDPLVPVLQIQ